MRVAVVIDHGGFSFQNDANCVIIAQMCCIAFTSAFISDNGFALWKERKNVFAKLKKWRKWRYFEVQIVQNSVEIGC